MLLSDVWIDAPHRHRRLTLFRLMDPEGRTLPYRLMSEALEAGTLAVQAARLPEWSRPSSADAPTPAPSTTSTAPENRIADEERAWPDRDRARQFLERVAGARRAETSPVGRGAYRTLSGPVVGGELTDAAGDVRDGERLVHLSAFPEFG